MFLFLRVVVAKTLEDARHVGSEGTPWETRSGNTDRDGKFIAPRSCLLEGPGIADPQSGLVPTISQLGLYPADLRRSAARH